MLTRCALNGQVVAVFKAKDDRLVPVTLWNMPEARPGVTGSVVFLSTSREECTPNYGTPIPPTGDQFTIYLEPGETLFGLTSDEALLGVSIGPGRVA
jgi:hypothetical protein